METAKNSSAPLRDKISVSHAYQILWSSGPMELMEVIRGPSVLAHYAHRAKSHTNTGQLPDANSGHIAQC